MKTLKKTSLTNLEASALFSLAKSMDEKNCGWYHEFFANSLTDKAVFGSLVKKGLATITPDYESPEPCDWIEITALGLQSIEVRVAKWMSKREKK